MTQDTILGLQQIKTVLTLKRLIDSFMPALYSIIAIFLIASYPITETTTNDLRDKIQRGEPRSNDFNEALPVS
jgi:Na+/melibiose symporter-like transporter